MYIPDSEGASGGLGSLRPPNHQGMLNTDYDGFGVALRPSISGISGIPSRPPDSESPEPHYLAAVLARIELHRTIGPYAVMPPPLHWGGPMAYSALSWRHAARLH